MRTNLFVDDYCSYMAYLQQDERRVNIRLIDWRYKCDRLQRPVLSKSETVSKN